MNIRMKIAKELDLCGYSYDQALLNNGQGKSYHVRLNRYTDSNALNTNTTRHFEVAGENISTLSGCDKIYRVFLLIILACTSEDGESHLWAKSELADLGEIGLRNFVSKYAEHLEFTRDKETMKVNYFRFSIFIEEAPVR